MTKQSDNQQRSTFSVFGAKPNNSILVPEIAMAVRNNCQTGQWVIGDTDYGSKCSMTIVKYSKFFGDLGKTSNALWAQIWFVAESGDLPKGVVMVTYLKTQSLKDFNRLIISVQSREIEPATGIFVPTFKKCSGDKGAYYALTWEWEERTDFAILDQAIAVRSDASNESRLIDWDGEKTMQCLDNLTPEELLYIVRGSDDDQPTLSASATSEVKALPPAS